MKSKTKKRLIVLAIILTAVIICVGVFFIVINPSYNRLFNKTKEVTYMTIDSVTPIPVEITKKEDIDNILDVFKTTKYKMRLKSIHAPDTEMGASRYKIKLYDKKDGTLYHTIVVYQEKISEKYDERYTVFIDGIAYYADTIYESIEKALVENNFDFSKLSDYSNAH